MVRTGCLASFSANSSRRVHRIIMKKKGTVQGKVALVTGGSRGIGKAVTLLLAKERITIVIGYLRNDQAAGKTAEEVEKLRGNTWLCKMDLRNPDEIKAMFQEIKERYGRLDIFVHAAALGVFKPMLNLSPIQLSRTFDINVRSFVMCVQESSKLMDRGGSIVAISSLGSQRYVSEYGAMGIAKACLEAAVRYLAVELAPRNIRVNAVAGGPVDTAGVKLFSYYERGRRQSIKMTPAGRLATPRDIANVIAFLCEEESGWIRGQTLIADGGLSLKLLSL